MISPQQSVETLGAATQEPRRPLTLPGANLGLIGLRHTVELPEGYDYVNYLDPEAAAELLRGHYPDAKTTVEEWSSREASFMRHRYAIVHVGVRSHETDELVGMGRLHYVDTWGGLSGFVVHTDHRSIGIGKAIIDERLNVADQLGLNVVDIPCLESSNTLWSYYLAKGFKQTDDGGYIRTPKIQLIEG